MFTVQELEVSIFKTPDVCPLHSLSYSATSFNNNIMCNLKIKDELHGFKQT